MRRFAHWKLPTLALLLVLAAPTNFLHAGEGEETYQLPLPEIVIPPVPSHPMVVIISDLTGNAAQPIPSVATIENALDDVAEFYEETSYAKITFQSTVVATSAPLDSSPTCERGRYPDLLQPIAEEAVAAADDQVDYGQFTHLMVYVPLGQDCEWGGVYKGLRTYDTNEGSVNLHTMLVNTRHTKPLVPGHELGHSLGLGHASRFNCDQPFPEDSTSCEFKSQSDPHSPIGKFSAAQQLVHFGAVHKHLLGWFDPADIVPVRQSGTFDVKAIAPDLPGVKALKICRAPGKELYVETRRAVLSDGNLPADGVAGVLLHLRDRELTTPPFNSSLPTESYLIDPTPGVPNTFSLRDGDPPLADPVGGFSVEVVGENHRKSTVSISGLDLPADSRPVTGLTCSYIDPIPPSLPDGIVTMTWSPGDCYDSVEVRRDGQLIWALDRDAVATGEVAPVNATYTYTITGIIDGLDSTDVSCTVEVPCPPCRADYDGNGIIDSADQAQFFTFFSAGDLRADLNCDGVLDLADAGHFAGQLGGTCP